MNEREQLYYLKGDGEDEMERLGHRLVFDARGRCVNVGGLALVDPAALVPVSDGVKG